MSDSLTYKKDGNKLKLTGTLDEYSNLKSVFNCELEKIHLDMSKVIRANASGIRSWITHINEFKGMIVLSNCTVAIVELFNEIPRFLGKNIIVESFYAIFYCEECDLEKLFLLKIEENSDKQKEIILESPLCPDCGEIMDKDFDESNYFGFVRKLNYSESLSKDTVNINEDQSHFVRKPLYTHVDLFLPDENNCFQTEPVKLLSENISENGMFLPFFSTLIDEKYLKVGTICKIEFEIPSLEKLKITCRQAVTECFNTKL